MRVALKITLAVTVWTLIVLVGHANYRIASEVRLLERDLARELLLVGRAVAPAVQHAWQRGGDAAAVEAVAEAQSSEREVGIRWVRLDAGASGDERPRVPAETARALIKSGRAKRVVGAEAEPARLVRYVPVAVVGEGEGAALELSVPLDTEEKFRARAFGELAVIALLIGVCSVIAATVLGWTLVGRRVGALVEVAQAVGRGEMPAELPVRRRDELGVLTTEMNRMTRMLHASQQRAEREAQGRSEALEQLRHADRLATMGMLLGRVAHDIGTPLNVVAARAKRVARGQVEGEEAKENARIAAEQADRIAASIRNLLDFARKGTTSSARVAPSLVLSRTMDLTASLAKGRGVVLHSEDHSQGASVRGDAAQLQQALTNLVVNAIHASPAGGAVAVSVGVASQSPPKELGGEEGPHMCFAVRDQGPGVPEELREQVFEPFFTTKPSGEGTGLGLAIAGTIVREHRGWIALVERPEGGSEFQLWLPLAEAT